MTDDVMHITLRVYKLPGDGESAGGFVLAELIPQTSDTAMEQHMRSARGDIDQILGSIGRIVRAWDVETTRLIRAQNEDENPRPVQKQSRGFWNKVLRAAEREDAA